MTPPGGSPRLGRGLASLMGDTSPSPAADSSGIRALAIDLLIPGSFQPRKTIDRGALDDLAQSIRARGVLQPLLVRPVAGTPVRYEIIAGERRWQAAQIAGLSEIPALVRDLSDADAMAAALVENLQRQDLNPVEEAEGFRRLINEFGLTQEALGSAVGKSRSHIANTIRLLSLPVPVQAELKKGTISAGHARALLAHPEPDKAVRVVIARGLNVRQTEALASRRHAPPAPRAGTDGGAAPDPETAAIARDLSERLGLQVDISFDGKGGQMRIRYRSLDQLDGLLALLMRSD